MVSVVDINIEDLIEKVITSPPSAPFTYNLQFEDVKDVKGIFEFCMEVFTKLSKYKYGDATGKVDISKWTSSTLDNINEYFKSLGFVFSVNILDHNDPSIGIFNSMRYDVIKVTPYTKLSSIMYMLKTKDKIYAINFDYHQM